MEEAATAGGTATVLETPREHRSSMPTASTHRLLEDFFAEVDRVIKEAQQ